MKHWLWFCTFFLENRKISDCHKERNDELREKMHAYKALWDHGQEDRFGMLTVFMAVQKKKYFFPRA